MEPIHSRQNAQVKALRRAAADNGRVADGLFLAEGWHSLEEAAKHGVGFRQVFVREDVAGAWESFAREYGIGSPLTTLLSADVFDSAVSTETPQGVAAFLEQPLWDVDSVLTGPAPLAVVLAGVQDPGNVGTILRSAWAMGAEAAFVLPGCAHPFGAKALRAAAGAAFALPVFGMRWEEVEPRLRQAGLVTVATVPRDGVAPADVPWGSGIALLIGSEGAGLPEAMIAAAGLRVTIPMRRGTESLNAAVAASILLYEAAKAR